MTHAPPDRLSRRLGHPDEEPTAAESGSGQLRNISISKVTSNPTTGEGDWPAGLVSHSGGVDESGHLVVMEVWDTPEHQARFMESRLGEALVKGGITEPPTSVTWIELIAHHHPGD